MIIDPHAQEALAIWNLLGEYSWQWLVERIEQLIVAGERSEAHRLQQIALRVHKLGL